MLVAPVLSVHAQTLTVGQSQTNATCFGSCNGSASVNPSGGSPPYTFVWSPNSAFTSSVNGLCAGNYYCVVTDNVGASVTATFVITEPPQIMLSVSTTDILCYASCTGSATVTATGGTGSYMYSWAPSLGTSPTPCCACAGNYTCTVTDNNGCTSTITMTITQPPAWSASITVISNVNCAGGNDGSAEVNVNGNTPPYTYSWSPNGATSDSVTNLSAGSHTCTVTDSTGCTVYSTVTITQPPQISYTATVVNPLCNGETGTVTIVMSGGVPPYSGDSTYNFFAGTNLVVLSDANGCSSPIFVVLQDPPPLFASIAQTVNPSSCGASDGSLNINVGGGTPGYTYQWSNNVTTQDQSGLGAGIYFCTITDANGCTQILTTSLTDPTAPSVSYIEPNDTACYGVTPPYALSGGFPSGGTYSGPGVSGGIFDPMNANMGINYIVYTYTDSNGCTRSVYDVIYVDLCLDVPSQSESTARIYPNPSSGIFTVATGPGAVITVYNSLGSLIMSEVASGSKSEIDLTALAEGIYLVAVEQKAARVTQLILLSR